MKKSNLQPIAIALVCKFDNLRIYYSMSKKLNFSIMNRTKNKVLPLDSLEDPLLLLKNIQTLFKNERKDDYYHLEDYRILSIRTKGDEYYLAAKKGYIEFLKSSKDHSSGNNSKITGNTIKEVMESFIQKTTEAFCCLISVRAKILHNYKPVGFCFEYKLKVEDGKLVMFEYSSWDYCLGNGDGGDGDF